MKSNHKKLKKRCDNLWAEAIKLRAGNKSEWSGKIENLQAHHIVGKSNYRLRYELNNGICLTVGEHFWIAHNQNRQELFRQRIKEIKGKDIYDRLNLLRGRLKTDIRAVEIYLINEINRLKNEMSS